METTASPSGVRTFEGSCHCGRVRFRVTGNLANTVDCNGSMCTKKNWEATMAARETAAL
jgi:hypothetical protein